MRLIPIFLAIASLATPAIAQVATDEAIRAIEAEASGGGAEDEVDAAAAQAAVPAGEPVPGVDSNERRRIEEIVVRARRRDELLEDTPVSVTALNEAAIRDSTITRINQITQLVPNLQFDSAGGTSTTARVFIRGVGINDTIMTNQPGVGIYVDGVYMARAAGSVLDVVDFAQIEVLRGPQGTLFGKNTAGGAINITTVKPSEELEGWALVRPGNLGRIDTRAVLNLPLYEDKVLSRWSFASLKNRGYTYNEFRDEYWSNQNSVNFQGALRFQLLDDLLIDVSGNYTKNHARPRGANCFFVRDVATQSLSPGFADNCKAAQAAAPDTVYEDVHGIQDLESYGVWGTLQYDIGELGPIDELTLKSITAWRRQTDSTRRDFDASQNGVLAINIAGGPLEIDGEPFESEQISQELQVNGHALDSRLSWVSGLYYLSDDAQENSGTAAFYDGPFVPGAQSVANREVDNYTIGVFGQATYDVLDWMGLTGGVRWTKDSQGYRIFNYELLDPESPKGAPVLRSQVTQDTDDREDFEAWTPMASLSMTLPEEYMPAPLDHLLGYFTYSTGFKGGGFNARTGSGFPPGKPPPTFDPEHVKSYEIGFKTVWFDRRLTANASFFLADYTDQQVLTLISVPCATPEDPTCLMIQAINANAASSTVKGAEIEFLGLPTDGLQLTWNVGLLDSEYDEFLSTSQIDDSPLDRRGESFNNVPEFTTFLAAQYSLPITSGAEWLTGWLTPRVEWYYRSSVHINGPELESSNQWGVGLLNARLSYDFLDDRAQVALWGRNLTDERYKTDSIPVAPLGFDSVYFAVGRTWGAELSYRF
ncbi:MAG: TonB-dependent receptor [Candidatus Binatia bacterium]|nr:TonB-dependent receptor [Candidatus Binatia bacterium]